MNYQNNNNDRNTGTNKTYCLYKPFMFILIESIVSKRIVHLKSIIVVINQTLTTINFVKKI